MPGKFRIEEAGFTDLGPLWLVNGRLLSAAIFPIGSGKRKPASKEAGFVV